MTNIRVPRDMATGIHGGEPLAAVIARELGLAPHDAESAIHIARKEVAL